MTLSAGYDALAETRLIYLAAVAAMNDASGVIQSCHVNGSFDVHNSGTGTVRIGGGVARNDGVIADGANSSTIRANCSAAQVGGIVGYCADGSVTGCANTASAQFGIFSRTPTVSYCYNTGSTVEGLKDSYAAENSYDTGAGLKGSVDLGTSLRLNTTAHSYFAKGTAYQRYDTELTDTQTRAESSYTGFDFEND